MLDTSSSALKLDVERGPDWIFVRVNPPDGLALRARRLLADSAATAGIGGLA